jgi:Domain of unknown function (DUF4249)
MKLFRFLIALVFFYACQPQFDLTDKATNPPKLVVWCVLHPDSIPTAYISQTSPELTKNNDRKISKAEVVLFQNNLPIDTFIEKQTGTYQSGKKPRLIENAVYHITVSKNGFDKLETPKDTLPEKPVILSTETKDSAIIKEGKLMAMIKLKTKQPSHYKNLGFGNFFASGLPIFIGSDIRFLPEGNISCENGGFYSFLNYKFILSSCVYSGENYYLYAHNFYPQGFKKLEEKFTACAITNLSVTYLNKLYELEEQYTDFSNFVDIFWNPVYLPNYIKGGYGFFACYNTTNIEVKF